MTVSRPLSMVLGAMLLTAGALAAQTASLSLSKSATPNPVASGGNLVYTLAVASEGPDDALNLTLSDTLPPGTTFVSLAAPGWSCTTPGVGATGTVDCTLATFPPGSSDLTLTVNVDPSTPDGTLITNQATVATTTDDPDEGDNTGSVETTVNAPPPLALTLTKVDAPDPVTAGEALGYTLTVSLAGPGIVSATLFDTLPAGTTFVALAAPAGWGCTTPAVGGTGAIDCSAASPSVGDHVFGLTVNVGPLPTGSVLHNSATATATIDDEPDDRVVSAQDDEDTAVLSPANLTGTKSVAGTFLPGSPVTYTVILTNTGPGDQPDAAGNEFTDVLPAPLALVGAAASSGTAIIDEGTNTASWNGALPAAASVTITLSAVLSAAAAPGSTVSNQGTILFDAAGDGGNGGAGVTDDPGTAADDDPTSFVVVAEPAAVEIPLLGGHGIGVFAGALAAAALLLLRVFRSAIAE